MKAVRFVEITLLPVYGAYTEGIRNGYGVCTENLLYTDLMAAHALQQKQRTEYSYAAFTFAGYHSM